MKLSDLLEKVEYDVLSGNPDTVVRHLVYDSRKVKEGDVFVCIRGAASDGHQYISQVISNNAAAVVLEDEKAFQSAISGMKDSEGVFVSRESTPAIIKVSDTRYALALMSAAYFGYPADRLKTIGITGTKGKTTTAYMVRSMLESIGVKTGLMGTIETVIGDESYPAVNTTPESYIVQETFAKMADAGCECVVMEVSSQGLMMRRVAGFKFDYGVFTNIEPDHIGPNEHRDFEEYLHCKSMLFKQCRHGIVNADDPHVERVLAGHTCDVESFGIENPCELKAKDIRLFQRPGRLCCSYRVEGAGDLFVEIDLPGRFSVYNSLCAFTVCRHFTDDPEKLKKALKDIKVKGRTELVHVSDRFTLMIDYAHNAMSLESLLRTLREYEPGRIVTLFGCGGNRSRDRRFQMGEVSSRMADFTIVTSDNPRFEDPMAIIDDIVTGVKKSNGKYVVVPDRKEAIRYAITHALNGDVIILAGKGHETYQEIRGVKYPMDERVLISELLCEDEVKRCL